MAIKQWSGEPGHTILYDDTLWPSPGTAAFTADYWESRDQITGRATGRGTTLFVQHDEQRWVLRHYQRGGLPGKVLQDQYLYTGIEATRAFREFRLLHLMREKDLAVPTPVAAHVSRSGLAYRADLITAQIPDSEDLHQVLCQRALSDSEWFAIGAAVARLQHAQVYHHDLNVRNIMRDNEGTIWIIDFDRCYVRPGLRWKNKPLARLRRSLRKEAARHADFQFAEENWATIMDGYIETQSELTVQHTTS